jgi:hypothetical protein
MSETMLAPLSIMLLVLSPLLLPLSISGFSHVDGLAVQRRLSATSLAAHHF